MSVQFPLSGTCALFQRNNYMFLMKFLFQYRKPFLSHTKMCTKGIRYIFDLTFRCQLLYIYFWYFLFLFKHKENKGIPLNLIIRTLRVSFPYSPYLWLILKIETNYFYRSSSPNIFMSAEDIVEQRNAK